MSRVIWKGAISFGLVNVPVQLHPATRPERTSFNLLDKETADPIGYKQINKRTGKEVSRENIVRGFEYEKGHYVLLADEEIRAASPESTQTVDILSFVEAYSVSFLYLDTPYYLVPPTDAKKAGVNAREVEMAKKLIEDMTESWNPGEYHDTFRDEILALVDKKVREGKTREISEAAKAPAHRRATADVVDLSELLKRSLGRGRGKHAA